MARIIGRGGLLDRFFYFGMSLLIAAVVVYGFSHTVDANLIHAAVPRPILLYFHAAVFSGWLLFFILQSLLVRTRNVRLHRSVGWFGVALGASIPVLGLATSVVMTRFQLVRLHAVEDAVTDLIAPFFDMVSFAILFTLAIYWRKKAELHRRLLLLASCVLTSAAFSRFPPEMLPSWPGMLVFICFYAGVDVLILMGVVRDLIVQRRIHQVYLYALPALIFVQMIVIYLYQWNWPLCVKITRAVAG